MFVKIVQVSNLEEKSEFGKLVEFKTSMITLTLYKQCMISQTNIVLAAAVLLIKIPVIRVP